jgi:glycosyltransferase involved in cell wall biosynthesis
MTFEQFWHRVPGGTAVAALGMAEGLAGRPGLDLVGVAAAHREARSDLPIPVHHLPLPRVALYEAWHRLRRPSVQRATGPVDLIHATSIAIPPKSAPLVVTIHDVAWLHEPAHFTARGISFFDRGLKLALRDADIVMCSSRATLKDCAAHGFAADRLRFVPMGTEVPPASPEQVDAVRRTHGLPNDYILWTGTVEPRKNLPRLLEAYRALGTDLPLVLVGPPGWNEDLDALVADIRDRVKVVGFVPKEELAPLYAGATVFCFPSLLEGFGLPVLEAMAQGTPVVTSRGTSTEELAEGAGVLVDPLDVDSIRAGLERVLGDQSFADELANAGRKRVGEYSWDRTADLIEEIYREVAR